MINKKIKFIIFKSSWFILLLFTSCLPDPLEITDIPVVKHEIVVATQLIPDQSILVLLTRTFGALDASGDSSPEELLKQIVINDAIVTITGTEGTDTLSFLEDGVYGGIFKPFREGEVYELRVKSEALGEVYATATVQPQVLFKEVEVSLNYNYDDTLAHITYSINDPAERNRYMLNVQEVTREDVVLNAINPEAFTLLLEDTDFNGNVYTDQFEASSRNYAPGDTIAVSLSNISEAYYQFMKLRIDNRLSLIEFLSEPVNYPSNVVGGKGFFNLYVPDIRVFVFDQD